ncbi:MAG TPA: dihydrodipicolinate synthase family protein [Actinomycetota bacterium]|nr:dihydrodipicolinate synthase family protein [Actinomycetota bacterium]
MDRLHGAIAAAVTPLRDGGRALDTDSLAPLVAFLANGGLDGLLACGTTGEGVLLTVDERRRVTEAFVAAAPASFQIAVHAGAQSTSDTVALAAHARDAGAAAVAVIAPPYFPLGSRELFDHFVAAATACDPLPFYVYEFAARSGYTIPVDVVRQLRKERDNVVGMKVSDTPFDAVEPYLGEDGMDVFIGSEPLVRAGMERGAVGAVSGLATAWPSVVSALVHDHSPEAHLRVTELRERLDGIPFQSALKQVLLDEGVLPRADVRPPLRGLTLEERTAVSAIAVRA